MPKHPRLRQVGNRFHLRAKIPRDIRPIFEEDESKPNTEIWVSLRTSDPSVALERVRVESVKVDQEFAKARRKLQEGPGPLADVEARRMVLLWFHREEGEAGDRPPPVGDVREALADLDYQEHTLTSADERVWLEATQLTVDRILIANGWRAKRLTVNGIERMVPVAEVDATKPEYWRFRQLVRRALIEHVRRERSRLLGQPAGQAFDALFTGVGAGRPEPDVPSPSTVTLERLVDLYIDDPAKDRSAKTRAGYVVIFRALKELLGPDKPVRDVTREDCRRVRDVIMRLPPNAGKRFPGLGLEEAAEMAADRGLPTITPKSANSYLNNLAGLFNWAVAEGYAEQNPATRLTVAVPKRARKTAWRPFSDEQLRAIFNAPLYVGCANDAAGYATPGPNVVRRGRFWVPVLALFTGMRLNEVCQLRVDDVVHRDGVSVILVREQHADQRVKSEAGDRVIPVHPELRKIGFMDHVKEMREACAERLFPELPVGKKGYYSDPFAKWFQRFVEKAGARRPNTSFHSFRHCFRDALREAGVGRDGVLALGGWSAGGTEEVYGSGLRPSTLAEEIEKVSYPGLDLSHLHKH